MGRRDLVREGRFFSIFFATLSACVALPGIALVTLAVSL